MHYHERIKNLQDEAAQRRRQLDEALDHAFQARSRELGVDPDSIQNSSFEAQIRARRLKTHLEESWQEAASVFLRQRANQDVSSLIETTKKRMFEVYQTYSDLAENMATTLMKKDIEIIRQVIDEHVTQPKVVPQEGWARG